MKLHFSVLRINFFILIGCNIFDKINCFLVGKLTGFNVKIICICPFSTTLNLILYIKFIHWLNL